MSELSSEKNSNQGEVRVNQHPYKEFLQSFARKKSRAFSRDQQLLMDEFYPKIRLNNDISNFDDLSNNPVYSGVYLEIGFGAGEHLLHVASQNEDKLIIGAEVFLNGVASAVQEMEGRGLDNIIFYDDDSRVLLKNIPENSLEKIFILFSDPWPKKRHHKRRIINQETLGLLHKSLCDGGVVRIATDHAEYYDWIMEVCDEGNQSLFLPEVISQPEDHIVTRYQQKGIDEGRPSQFLELHKKL